MRKPNSTKDQHKKAESSLRSYEGFKDIAIFFDNIHKAYLELLKKRKQNLKRTKQTELSPENKKEMK